MEKEFHTHFNNIDYLGDSYLVNNLNCIYCTEKYCLRRFPRIVNLVESKNLSKLLSDHVSIIMDRLNLLEGIFSYYHVRPSSLKSFSNFFGANMKGFFIKNNFQNHLIITDLIELIKYRITIYELLVAATNVIEQTNIRSVLLQILAQEAKLLQDLNCIKKQFYSDEDLFNTIPFLNSRLILE